AALKGGVKGLGRIGEPGQVMAVRVAVVVVAGGRGTRSGLNFPKKYKVLGGTPMVRASLRVFTEHPAVDLVLPVIHPDDSKRFAIATQGLRLARPVAGAATRQGSVRAGLESLPAEAPEIVLVHDAARPFTS